MTTPTFSVQQITDFSIRCLVHVGVPENEATLISETLVEADAKGIHSHGVMRLPLYVDRMQHDLVRPAAKIEVVSDKQSSAVIDAHFSAGQVAAHQAIDLATQKATEFGIGIVSVRNSNHFGIAAHYALQAAQSDMIGIAMSNTTPLMPPTGGAEKVLGNNPLAIAAPSNNPHPLLLDMALSNVALGKIIYAKTQNSDIPEGWGANAKGQSTTDPAAVLDGGFILPLGGPKGFGLALMIELLTGGLANSQFSKMIPSMYDLSQRQSIAHCMLAINIGHFIEIERFKTLASQLSAFIKEAKKADGVTQLYLPGEIECQKEAERRQHGIPVDPTVCEELHALAQSLKLPILGS